ncbi:uncharacterized protein Asalp_18900 [Aeromonas salmonicida subsp. pectinolytica 34mel]|uniref:Uncharacterized protein n=1 Tax=Aeromonas salmonicida subsp. pectinolytica 34mel TaxID=1324960 RepID=A0A2D1QFU7_AERSA|nr:uncharacterized protein Asalp_18900 [Aeromonas salmonicida subsp. pectinolytica 34mel]
MQQKEKRQSESVLVPAPRGKSDSLNAADYMTRGRARRSKKTNPPPVNRPQTLR